LIDEMAKESLKEKKAKKQSNYSSKKAGGKKTKYSHLEMDPERRPEKRK
jgi:hypothetical protein